MPDEPERGVLDGFVRGDQQAFERLFRAFERDVHGWVLRIVRDASAADDVVVDAFWRAYRARARFDPSRSFGAWMRRIATHAALDHLRSNRRHPSSDAPVDDLAAPEAVSDALSASVSRALRTLPPKLRVVAALALIEERPYAEIADALAVPIGTVKSRVFRASQALRQELARLGIRP